ncbi:MAG: zinc ABC transporter substrate-binding protein [Deltaproteobacteria bacterium]|nr:zinc ABC transporter substrate-binding protein [Deltaproteobacteria bacterium]MBW2395188.1 zinc ABC transporter substrate-binding protein [Deltaproteobacteria bacterium]
MGRPRSLGFGLLAGLVALPGAAHACGSVVTTLVPLAFLVQEVGGERVEALALVPSGASPHAFEPRPSDAARAEAACLFVSAGDGSDAWAARLGDTLARGRHLSLASGLGLPTHAWLDPISVRDLLAPRLAEALAAADPDAAEAYAESLHAFQARLTTLDADVRAELAGAGRQFVALHDAWGAFAECYGLEAIGVLRHADGGEVGPRSLGKLVAKAREAGVRAILVEPQLPGRMAERIAEEFGAGTEKVDPLGDPADPARASYEALLRFNARAFRRAMGDGR